MSSIIEAQGLTVQLGSHTVLDNLSFSIEAGEIVAIVGPNGAGKTTLLKALLGLVPAEGTITLDSKRIGYVPQHLDFDRTMPVTVTELLRIHQRRPDQPQIRQVLETVDVGHLAERQLGLLSGGEFQRVLIALALLNEPDILFLDEPTASIDVEGAGEVYAVLNKLQEKQRRTIVLVSHELDVVFKHASHVLCINHKLICSGVPRDALNQDTLQALYGEHQTLYPHHEKGHV